MVHEDLKLCLEQAKIFHGHICPFLALGIRASKIAMEEMGINRISSKESIGEDILAIVECNNCFSDGVQIATGCTFGNNSLVYHDLGKNALTILKRGDWNGTRVYIDYEKIRERYFSQESLYLFEKVIVRRNGCEEDRRRLSKIWEGIGYRMLEVPKEEFKIERVRVSAIEQAPIFKSVRCTSCGELAMETRVTYIDKKPFCLKCAGEKYHAVIGRGIIEVVK